MVKALDLRSNVRMHTWVRTPFLVWDPDTFFFAAKLFLSQTNIVPFFSCATGTFVTRQHNDCNFYHLKKIVNHNHLFFS